MSWWPAALLLQAEHSLPELRCISEPAALLLLSKSGKLLRGHALLLGHNQFYCGEAASAD